MLVAFAGAGLVGCGGGGGDGAAGDGGTLALTIYTEVAGTPYRLSNATFEVTPTTAGAAAVTMSTAETPTALALQQSLTPGQYSVALQTGWVIERQAAGAFQPVAGATIMSAATITVNVIQGQIARAGFVFTAGDVTVDFQAEADRSDDPAD
jgi:hypothetical protein